MPHKGLLLFYGIKELQEASPQTHKVNAVKVRTLKNNNYATDMRTLKVRHLHDKQLNLQESNDLRYEDL